MNKAIVLACVSLVAVACSSGAPTAEITAATPDTIVAHEDATDDITMTVHYQDPDGDLGQGQVVVVDCRSTSVRSTFAIPEIANEQAITDGVTIEGDLDVVVTDVGMVDPGPLPQECEDGGVGPGSFCVVLVDTAGNESAPACTEPIVVQE